MHKREFFWDMEMIQKTYLIGSFGNGFLETSNSRNVRFNKKVFPGVAKFNGRNFERDEDIIFEIDEKDVR